MMKQWRNKIWRHRQFFLFVFFFAYVESIFIRTLRDEVSFYTFTPDAALGSFIDSVILFQVLYYFLQRWQKWDSFKPLKIAQIFIVSLVSYLCLINLIHLFIALSFNTLERNFNLETLRFSNFSLFLQGIVYGSFFLCYYYYNKIKDYRMMLSKYELDLSESKINQLKAQLNPHFLFNNLNVLDQLIEEDKTKASDFLNEFADIYRYVLQVSDKDWVTLAEELDFAQQYFTLIRYKYGAAYQLHINHQKTTGGIVPLTLQLLIENAVQHNKGTLKDPIVIQISLNERITVSNTLNIKRKSKITSGRALENLRAQYKILSEEPFEIEQSLTHFKVSLPLIPSTKL